eukprot:s5431_g1.t1
MLSVNDTGSGGQPSLESYFGESVAATLLGKVNETKDRKESMSKIQARVQQTACLEENCFLPNKPVPYRKGGLAAIGAVAVGLSSEHISYFLQDIMHLVIGTDTEQGPFSNDCGEYRIRYLACESLFNIAKVANHAAPLKLGSLNRRRKSIAIGIYDHLIGRLTDHSELLDLVRARRAEVLSPDFEATQSTCLFNVSEPAQAAAPVEVAAPVTPPIDAPGAVIVDFLEEESPERSRSPISGHSRAYIGVRALLKFIPKNSYESHGNHALELWRGVVSSCADYPLKPLPLIVTPKPLGPWGKAATLRWLSEKLWSDHDQASWALWTHVDDREDICEEFGAEESINAVHWHVRDRRSLLTLCREEGVL